MNRRDFLTRTLAFLPLPAFARAASLWLPKERRIVEPPKPEIVLIGSEFLRAGDAWTYSNDEKCVVILSFPDLERIQLSDQGVKLVMGPDGWEYRP